MDKCEIDEIIACLPHERTLFRYFKDAYVALLIGRAVGDGISISALRRSGLAPLLSKPAAKPLLALCGDGRIDRSRTLCLWREPSLPFLLSLGAWGGSERTWQQTSRAGWNLVLRLNFITEHDSRFEALFGDEARTDGLNYACHPVLRRDERSWYRQTLAWARLDLDFATGEALIEEIQSDWIAAAHRWRRQLSGTWARTPERIAQTQRRLQYLDEVLAPYAAIWDEAMLSATLTFLWHELGFHDIWYHSWHSGAVLKGIALGHGPPKSLYTELPRRFCFQSTEAMPSMLESRKRRAMLRRAGVEPRFFRLSIAPDGISVERPDRSPSSRPAVMAG